MRSSDARRSELRRRRRRLALVVGAASLLGLGGSFPAQAQEGTDGAAATGPTGEELFGAYQLEARGIGVQGTYEIEGLLPGGSPVMDLTLPETLARFGSGPSGYGLASLAYPGGILANFGSLVSQSGGPGEQVPPYPIKAEAFYPAGPTESDASQPGGIVQHVTSDARSVQVNASFPSIDAPPLVTVGSISSASRSAVEGPLAIGRTRVVLGDVRLLGGVITIQSLVTDLVAAHDGQTGSTNGGTVASGVRFLGLAASLTEKGLVLDKAPPAEGPAAPLGGALSDAVGPLSGITGPLQQQLAAVLDQAVPKVDDILARAGVSLAIIDPHDEQVDSGAASRTTSGLSLTMSYKGREQQALVDLINSVPPELKPNVGPIPNPVTFLAENHITGLALGPASVSSLATPPFPVLDVPVPDMPVDLGPVGDSGLPLTSPGFSTPTAPLPTPERPAPSTDGLDPISASVGGAVPAILVALALVASPLFGAGSARLADTALASASTSCPMGLDQPPAPPRPS
jgi:hypothetical protein